jgi:hypothetical protein
MAKRSFPVRVRLVLGGIALVVSLWLGGTAATVHAATCTGSDDCHACKNCKYCQHCAKLGGTCSVCRGKARS